MTDLTRYADVLAWLAGRCGTDGDVRVCWVGGSAATSGWDEWSDLDLTVLVTPGSSVVVHRALLAGLRWTFDVHDVWELPDDSWPDGRQSFVNLQARPGLLLEPTRLLDVCVRDLSESLTRIDGRRHGTPLLVHDPDELVTFGLEGAEAALPAAVDQVRRRRVTGEWLVNRALRRGHVAEAVDLYLRFPLAGVVRLARAEHCPWRHDFGLRYLRGDLPGEVADRIESLVPGVTDATLEELSADCFGWLDELLAHRTDP